MTDDEPIFAPDDMKSMNVPVQTDGLFDTPNPRNSVRPAPRVTPKRRTKRPEPVKTDADIKPIETRYAGCRFRSRLEARWAVFFDSLDVEWEYESQGYELPSGQVYLPDFRLPTFDLWVEVKGDEESFLADGPRYAEAIQTQSLPGRGLVVLGPVPDGSRVNPLHFVLTYEAGDDGTMELHADLLSFDSRDPEGNPAIFCTELASRKPGKLPKLTGYGRAGATYTKGATYVLTSEVAGAYTSARSARFEHGESG